MFYIIDKAQDKQEHPKMQVPDTWGTKVVQRVLVAIHFYTGL